MGSGGKNDPGLLILDSGFEIKVDLNFIKHRKEYTK